MNKNVRTILRILKWDHPEFPNSLRYIPNPPKLVYVAGDLDCLRGPAIAVVGTRTPTRTGAKMAEAFGRRLAKRGIVVVSGLALGIDAAAHEGCLAAGGQTIAVLPSGVSNVYPRENQKLAARIVKSGGCLVSEYPPDASPEKYTFIQRDRLQSGLSLGVVVVETDLGGGAMHTARFCRRQGRLLACVKPRGKHADDPIVSGNLALLRRKEAAALIGLADLDAFSKLCLQKVKTGLF
ncbi:MAG: DNA-processing protein DprA [Candidatus Omnitrophota bacterium]